MKTKKLLLGLGGVISLSAPIATVVACETKNKMSLEEINKGLSKLGDAIYKIYKSDLNDKFPGHFKVLGKIYSEGLQKINQDEIKTIVDMFAIPLREKLKTTISDERLAEIIYKLLHGWGNASRAQFEKDMIELIPQIPKLKEKVPSAVPGVHLATKNIFDLFWDGKWTLTTPVFLVGDPLYHLSDETMESISNVFKKGLLNSGNTFNQIVSGVTDFIIKNNGTTAMGFIKGISPAVKKTLDDIIAIMTKLKTMDINSIFGDLFNKPFKEIIDGNSFDNIVDILSAIGVLKNLTKEKQTEEQIRNKEEPKYHNPDELKTEFKKLNTIFTDILYSKKYSLTDVDKIYTNLSSGFMIEKILPNNASDKIKEVIKLLLTPPKEPVVKK